MNEAGFWKKIREGMQGRWHSIRVEPAIGSGFPDIDFAMTKMAQGKIELKYLPEPPVRASTKIRIKHFTPEQKLFFRERGAITGDVWLLVGVAKETFLFDWHTALIIEDKTLTEWRMFARAHWNGKIDFAQLARTLAGF